jgi:hypothetical protein
MPFCFVSPDVSATLRISKISYLSGRNGCRLVSFLLPCRSVSAIPPEAHIFVLATVLMAVLFVLALVRVWLLRRAEEKLLKNKAALEKQVVDQHREVLAIRSDSAQWRAEMMREFDAFRAMASDQSKVEERRFEELMKRCEQLQTSLDIARQMCAELPAAKARVLQLEHALGINGEEIFVGREKTTSSGTLAAVVEPRREWAVPASAPALPAVPSVEEHGAGNDPPPSLGV